MNVNFINFIFVTIFLVYCARRPRNGIIVSLFILLALATPFSSFGFSFGDGGKYLPNIFIVLTFYFVYFIFKNKKYSSFDLVGYLIIIYMALATIGSILVTSSLANIGMMIKRICIAPLFFFCGEVFADSETFDSDYKALVHMMLGLGIFMIAFSIIELLFHQNIFAGLLSDFIDMVGSTAFVDPGQIVEAHLRVDFYRLLGPQVESSEMAIVVLLVFLFCLSWHKPESLLGRQLKIIMLIVLPVLVLINSTRSVILLTFVMVIFNYFLLKIREKQRLITFSSGMVLIASGIFIIIIFNITEVLKFMDEMGVNPFFMERVEDDTNIMGRFLVWNEALKIIDQNFWLGVGFEPLDMPMMGDAFSVHNYYLDLLVHHGIFLTIFINIIFIILVLRSMKILKEDHTKTNKDVAQIFLMVALTMVIIGLANPEKNQISALFWFFGGLISSLWQRKAEQYA